MLSAGDLLHVSGFPPGLAMGEAEYQRMPHMLSTHILLQNNNYNRHNIAAGVNNNDNNHNAS